MIVMITHLDVAADGVVCFVSLGFLFKNPKKPRQSKTSVPCRTNCKWPCKRQILGLNFWIFGDGQRADPREKSSRHR